MAIQTRLNGSLQVSGLSIGANTIPHGLGTVPQTIKLRPALIDCLMYQEDVNQLWAQTAPSDGTNFYITVKAGAPLSGIVDFWC